jgi:xylulose-5-phosphate/fructose-6-phosphate phosphoketolase
MKQQTSNETSLDLGALQAVERYRRTINYLAAAQIYLKDNPLLEEPLRPASSPASSRCRSG